MLRWVGSLRTLDLLNPLALEAAVVAYTGALHRLPRQKGAVSPMSRRWFSCDPRQKGSHSLAAAKRASHRTPRKLEIGLHSPSKVFKNAPQRGSHPASGFDQGCAGDAAPSPHEPCAGVKSMGGPRAVSKQSPGNQQRQQNLTRMAEHFKRMAKHSHARHHTLQR